MRSGGNIISHTKVEVLGLENFAAGIQNKTHLKFIFYSHHIYSEINRVYPLVI